MIPLCYRPQPGTIHMVTFPFGHSSCPGGGNWIRIIFMSKSGKSAVILKRLDTIQKLVPLSSFIFPNPDKLWSSKCLLCSVLKVRQSFIKKNKLADYLTNSRTCFFFFYKGAFCDVLCVWDIFPYYCHTVFATSPSMCMEHALSCLYSRFPSICHNKLRYLTVQPNEQKFVTM